MPVLFREPNPMPIKYCLWRHGLLRSPECRLPLPCRLPDRSHTKTLTGCLPINYFDRYEGYRSAEQPTRLVMSLMEIGVVGSPETRPGENSRRQEFLLSVVVPCFNEEDVIRLTHRRLVDVLGDKRFCLQILFIDDGSDDATPEIAAELANNDPRVKTVHLSRNFGHQAAVSAGLADADGDAVVVMDADLQDPPEAVIQMI